MRSVLPVVFVLLTVTVTVLPCGSTRKPLSLYLDVALLNHVRVKLLVERNVSDISIGQFDSAPSPAMFTVTVLDAV